MEIGSPLPETGDDAEWSALYAAINPAGLLVLAEEITNPALRATLAPEDVLNMALAAIWADRARLRWQGPRAFRGLVILNMRRRIIDHARSLERSPEKRTAAQDPSDIDDDGAPSPGEVQPRRDLPRFITTTTTPSRIALLREQAAAIRSALDALPEEERTVLRLRILEQMPVVEISRAMGRAPETVRGLLVRGSREYARHLKMRLGSRPGGESVTP